jgi:hypothetical protein
MALLCACSDNGNASNLGTQSWGAIQVSVETRPSPPRHGRNEVVVLVSGDRHRPVYDAVIRLRAQQDAWVQAIEDGHVGVYRRAVDFGEGDHATLQVQLQRGSEETILEFPVPIGQNNN